MSTSVTAMKTAETTSRTDTVGDCTRSTDRAPTTLITRDPDRGAGDRAPSPSEGEDAGAHHRPDPEERGAADAHRLRRPVTLDRLDTRRLAHGVVADSPR